MIINHYNFNTGRWVDFEFKDDKNFQRAKKIETIANIFKTNENLWWHMSNLMNFLIVASILAILVLCLISLSPAQFKIPIYSLLGAGSCFSILSRLSVKVEDKNVKKAVATYYWAASLVREDELKVTLNQMGNLETDGYDLYFWNFNSGRQLNQKEKDLILNALEVTEHIDPKVPEGVCSQSVGATHCPCIPPCQNMKNVVAKMKVGSVPNIIKGFL